MYFLTEVLIFQILVQCISSWDIITSTIIRWRVLSDVIYGEICTTTAIIIAIAIEFNACHCGCWLHSVLLVSHVYQLLLLLEMRLKDLGWTFIIQIFFLREVISLNDIIAISSRRCINIVLV